MVTTLGLVLRPGPLYLMSEPTELNWTRGPNHTALYTIYYMIPGPTRPDQTSRSRAGQTGPRPIHSLLIFAYFHMSFGFLAVLFRPLCECNCSCCLRRDLHAGSGSGMERNPHSCIAYRIISRRLLPLDKLFEELPRPQTRVHLPGIPFTVQCLAYLLWDVLIYERLSEPWDFPSVCLRWRKRSARDKRIHLLHPYDSTRVNSTPGAVIHSAYPKVLFLNRDKQ